MMEPVRYRKEGDLLVEDYELWMLLVENPENGLEQLMRQYMTFVYTIVSGKLSGLCAKQAVEECVSDVFYEAYRTRHSIQLEKGSLKAYLGVLSKRIAIDYYRRCVKSAGKRAADETVLEWIAADDDVEKTVADKETAIVLIDQIKALGEPDSQIMIRKYYYGQSTKTIAKALGIKNNTVDKKVSRALVKLEKALGGVLEWKKS